MKGRIRMLSGRQLRLIRMHKRIDQKVLADKLNISINEIIILENEVRPIPDLIYKQWVCLLE